MAKLHLSDVDPEDRGGLMFRVLVVDDHAMNRLIGKEIFQYLGCWVETAGSGSAALDILRSSHFDLICLDRHMPELGGDSLLAELADDQFVLAWSTDTTDLPEGFDGSLAKPISIAAAAEAIVAALSDLRAGPPSPVRKASPRRPFA